MAPPLLSYQLNPSPEPLMVSPADAATAGYNQSVLTLTASNATTQAVTLNYLRLDLPLGSGATDLLALLTLDELQAAVAVTPDPAWTLYQTTVWSDANGQAWASYLFHPLDAGLLPADNSWTFSWQGVAPAYWGVPINTVPGGPVACQVVEGSSGNPIEVLSLEKAPAGWFVPTLVAAPEAVASGQAVQLSWNGPAGASYELNGLADDAPNPLPNAGAYDSAALLEDTVFTLQVAYTPEQGPTQHAAPQQTVTVLPPVPVINSFTGTMTWLDGQPQLLLSWDVAPSTATVIVSGNSNNLNPVGNWPVNPTANQPLLITYMLTATNAAGQSVAAYVSATYQLMTDSPVQVGNLPDAIAFTPDSSQAWIANGVDNTVTVLNTATHQPVAASPVAVGTQPKAIAFTPDGSQAWVVNSRDNTVTVIDTATYQPVAASPISVGSFPVAIAFTPNGRQAWVVNYYSDTITVLDTATCQPVADSPVQVNSLPQAIAFTPDGRQAWIVSLNASTVAILDTATYQPVPNSPLAIGGQPIAIAFTPDGRQAWIVNNQYDTATVLDTATYQPVLGSPVAVGSGPQAVAIAPGGGQAWVVNMPAGNVTILDTATLQPISGSPLAVGNMPNVMAFAPNGSQAYVSAGGNAVSIAAVTAYVAVSAFEQPNSDLNA